MASIFADRQPSNVGDVISDGFMYEPKGVAVDGRGIRQNVPPYNASTFAGGSTMLFNIPCSRPNHFLNGRQTVLKFDITNTDATAGDDISLDYVADSLIQSLTLYHGSNQLENLREYGVLSVLQKDLQGTPNKQRLLEGQHASTARTGLAIDDGSDVLTVCLALNSGLIGKSAPKYLPSFAMTGGDLRLEIELASNTNGVVHAVNEAVWSISNVELLLEYGELTPSATESIMRAYPDFVFNFDTFENSAQTVASATQAQVLIPARYSRLKTLYSTFRNTAVINVAAAKTVSNRSNPSMSSWYYSVGGVHYPPTAVSSTAAGDGQGGLNDCESFCELTKAYHGLGDRHDVQINLAEFNQTYGAVTDDAAHAIGMDLEWLTNKSHSAISGIDTKTLNTYLIASWASAPGYTQQIDTFAQFDAVAFLRSGVMDVRR